MTSTAGHREIQLSAKKQVIFFFCILLFLIVFAEASIRCWAYFFRTSYERYNPSTNRLELVPNLRYVVGGDEFLINSKGFLGPEFNKEKPKGIYRMIALGDSCTFSDGIWKNGYPAMLQKLLNGENSPKEFEVINAGIEGYNSTLARDRLSDELLDYDPDLVIIYIGWNDLMKSDPRNTSTSDEYSLFAWIKDSSYIFKAYRKLIFFYLRPILKKPKTDAVDTASAFENFTPRRYQANVESMIKTLKAKRVNVILLTLPTVIHSGMTYQEMQEAKVVFPYFAGANSVPAFLNLLRAHNEVVLRLGSKYGVPIVDLNRRFSEADTRGLFWDTMHPSYEGKQVIASAIFARMREIRSNGQECRLYGWDDLCVSKHD